MSEVVVVARAKAQPGKEEEMAQALRANAETSRGEDGCLSYSVLRGDEGVFMTVERWATRGHVQSHMAAPHVQALLQAITPLVAGPPDIQVLEEV